MNVVYLLPHRSVGLEMPHSRLQVSNRVSVTKYHFTCASFVENEHRRV
jgi:hypothetical protein